MPSYPEERRVFTQRNMAISAAPCVVRHRNAEFPLVNLQVRLYELNIKAYIYGLFFVNYLNSIETSMNGTMISGISRLSEGLARAPWVWLSTLHRGREVQAGGSEDSGKDPGFAGVW
jgi:hypothetical protein